MIEPDLSHDVEPVTERTLRQFAILCFVFLAALASWRLAHGHQTSALVLGSLGAALAVLGLLQPAAIRPLFAGLMVVTFPVGWVVSRLLLAVIFFGIFTPVGVLFKLIRRDALSIKPNAERETYWTPKPMASDVRSYLKQS